MIIFVDPDDYDKKLAQKKGNKVPEPRPGTQGGRAESRLGKRNRRTDGMKTAAGFYPRGRGKHEAIEEDIEVIKVEPRSDDESDKVSELS